MKKEHTCTCNSRWWPQCHYNSSKHKVQCTLCQPKRTMHSATGKTASGSSACVGPCKSQLYTSSCAPCISWRTSQSRQCSCFNTENATNGFTWPYCATSHPQRDVMHWQDSKSTHSAVSTCLLLLAHVDCDVDAEVAVIGEKLCNVCVEDETVWAVDGCLHSVVNASRCCLPRQTPPMAVKLESESTRQRYSKAVQWEWDATSRNSL